ncbi:hypothetical protein SAICODRAFT_22561 [Saitoella complicata NRRL Y-17804]|uniref:uncharacterized protein n=1 Tax=Saitoella complicata (strain BCRC 22490 / CBS 7301 / JCM 7358 / NBRC 10748 / NRRL Y-17804) TaxID=698492 RepID=UPI0008682224|nr:uncharacterized protein SAICODRAFT_22561 [Saitoella complicata NRRL Y-17804]ODQ56154.1 hypothetical protein SAICODRAFT_22561 [Saitoella complicata NRRL Y-17804]
MDTDLNRRLLLSSRLLHAAAADSRTFELETQRALAGYDSSATTHLVSAAGPFYNSRIWQIPKQYGIGATGVGGEHAVKAIIAKDSADRIFVIFRGQLSFADFAPDGILTKINPDTAPLPPFPSTALPYARIVAKAQKEDVSQGTNKYTSGGTYVHLGFWALWYAAEGLETRIMRELSIMLASMKTDAKPEIWILGYGIGGAIASFATQSILTLLSPPHVFSTLFPNTQTQIHHHTFSSPPIGNYAFRTHYDKQVTSNIDSISLRFDNDPLPTIFDYLVADAEAAGRHGDGSGQRVPPAEANAYGLKIGAGWHVLNTLRTCSLFNAFGTSSTRGALILAGLPKWEKVGRGVPLQRYFVDWERVGREFVWSDGKGRDGVWKGDEGSMERYVDYARARVGRFIGGGLVRNGGEQYSDANE